MTMIRMAARSMAASLPQIALAALLMSLVPAGALAVDDCTPADGYTPICNLQRPEDLEALPGGKLILISEYGALSGAKPGRLTAYRPADDARIPLFPAAGAPAKAGADAWGDPACPGPPGAEFSPHGIHHSNIGGTDRVLVVNHGGREAVEMFELAVSPDGSSASLTWRGCVVAPEKVWMNDVAGLPAGGFAVSHMVERGTAEEALLEAERTRADTGEVLEWSATGGWRRVPGTAGGLPNGIEVSDDGATLYVNYYFGDAVAAIDRASGRRLWQAEVPSPDNASWDIDGRLLVASHRKDLAAVIACGEDAAAPYCKLPFAIVALDAQTGAAVTLIEGDGETMGAATVALPFGDALYLGAYVGGRMARIPLAR